MIFNGIEKSYLTVLRGKSRPAWAPLRRELVTVTGTPGAYLSYTEKQIRQIEVPVLIEGADQSDLQTIKEDLADWLVHDEQKELIFKDEPDRTYYALVNGSLDLDELVGWGQGIITFVCPDPYKYGPTNEVNFTGDNVLVRNYGTADAEPVFELIANQRSTYAMVTNGEEYNLIGEPADDDIQVINSKNSVLYENGSTIDTWTHTTERQMISHDVNIDGLNGTMGTDGAGIRIESRGPTTQKQNGPAVFKELPSAIQDFEVESTFDIISRREIENWRMMIYLLDENMNNIGHMGVKDNSRLYKRRTALSQLGRHRQGVTLIGDKSYVENNARDTTLFYLRFRRQGKRFTVYIAHWRNQKHETVWEASYNDRNNQFQGKLKYITLFIGRYQDRVNPNRARINSVEVFELTQATQDQTPYIIYPGDIITFDHKDKNILINGEARKDLKNFGSSFFSLKRGDNAIIVEPTDTFVTKATYRERYK